MSMIPNGTTTTTTTTTKATTSTTTIATTLLIATTAISTMDEAKGNSGELFFEFRFKSFSFDIIYFHRRFNLRWRWWWR